MAGTAKFKLGFTVVNLFILALSLGLYIFEFGYENGTLSGLTFWNLWAAALLTGVGATIVASLVSRDKKLLRDLVIQVLVAGIIIVVIDYLFLPGAFPEATFGWVVFHYLTPFPRMVPIFNIINLF